MEAARNLPVRFESRDSVPETLLPPPADVNKPPPTAKYPTQLPIRNVCADVSTRKHQNCSRSSVLPRLSGLTLPRMHKPRNANAEYVQHHHWRCEDAHVHDVGGRSNDGRNGEDSQD